MPVFTIHWYLFTVMQKMVNEKQLSIVHKCTDKICPGLLLPVFDVIYASHCIKLKHNQRQHKQTNHLF